MVSDEFSRDMYQHLLQIQSQNVLLFFVGKMIAKDSLNAKRFDANQIAKYFSRMGLGKLKLLEKHDAHKEFIFRLDNSPFKTKKKKASCYVSCGLLAGYVEGVFKRYTGAKESKCISKGDKYCEIRVKVLQNND